MKYFCKIFCCKNFTGAFPGKDVFRENFMLQCTLKARGSGEGTGTKMRSSGASVKTEVWDGKGIAMKILIVEDDAGLGRGISFALEQEGRTVFRAQTLKEAKALWEKESPDALILDLNLPDGDGIDFCKKIRKFSDVPILILTARDMETDEIIGLTSGADDYITKPFSVSVLKLRLQKILERRREKTEGSTVLKSGEISLDTKSLHVFRGEERREVDLTMTEFRLLQYFLENKNQVLLKEQILQHIWDADGNFVEENTLSVNISRLRKKLGGDCIRTIQGMGYLWEDKA